MRHPQDCMSEASVDSHQTATASVVGTRSAIPEGNLMLRYALYAPTRGHWKKGWPRLKFLKYTQQLTVIKNTPWSRIVTDGGIRCSTATRYGCLVTEWVMFLIFKKNLMARTDRRSPAGFLVRCSAQTSRLFIVENGCQWQLRSIYTLVSLVMKPQRTRAVAQPLTGLESGWAESWHVTSTNFGLLGSYDGFCE